MTDDVRLDPTARSTDPETSHAAASRVRLKAQGWPREIVNALAYRWMTDDELCQYLGAHLRHWPSIKSARSRLKKIDRVTWTGRVRKGQMVWRLKEDDASHTDR